MARWRQMRQYIQRADVIFAECRRYLQAFKKILTVNTGMVMVNYKKYGMIQSQMDKCFLSKFLVRVSKLCNHTTFCWVKMV